GDLCYEHDRLNKGNPYEGSARVPMLIRFPECIAAGQTYMQPMGTVDVTPTLLGLAGIKTNHEFEGRDLTAQFSGGGAGQGKQVTFLRNSGTEPQWVCAVDDRFKLVLSVNDQPWLFDAEQDPDELLNFYRRPGSRAATQRLAIALQQYGKQKSDAHLQHPAIVASLKKCLAAKE
ncbi:MAG TPA: sulfatase, partial [Rhodopirellula sp.]|nr:sulfatase [Rhodopirellula sp.]